MSEKKSGTITVVELSPGRRLVTNLNDLNFRTHFMYGLLEVDVTEAKQYIEEHKARTGELLSFTGYLAFCLARAVDEDKSVQAYLKGRKQLVIIDDVDVGLVIERQKDGKPTLTGYIVRGANRKTYREIHQEIRAAQSRPVPPGGGMPSWLISTMLSPWPLSSLFKALLRAAVRRDPTVFTSMGGTVGITAVGMFGEGEGGWGIAPISHSLGLVVGSTAWKPGIVGREELPHGRVEPREILNLTVAFNHDVIDGAPAARFARRLVELIESGYGLDEDQPAAISIAHYGN
jgi:pyruvate/2-oxoglutarate dehydrogenase complex dihydrolipoamide acyltransferase (E2) component